MFTALAVPPKYRDVFDFAVQRWLAENPTLRANAASVKRMEQFAEFARQLFVTNQPTGMDNTDTVLAIRFQDGTVLRFADIESTGMSDAVGSMQIASPVHRPDQATAGATLATVSYPISGTDRK